jgi:hypothetical protein
MEKIKETSNREQSNRRQAISWWNNLPDSLNNGKDKQSYYDTYKAYVYSSGRYADGLIVMEKY